MERNDLKMGAWTVCRFKRGLGKKEEGGVFERECTMHAMNKL